jgi:hypothetical protein
MIARTIAAIAFMDAARPVMKEVAEGRLPRETAITLMATIAFGGSAEAVPVEPPFERPAERRDRINAELLRQLLDLEREGKGCGAVDFLARKRARDQSPAAVDALKKHLWRLWRRHKKKRTAPPSASLTPKKPKHEN